MKKALKPAKKVYAMGDWWSKPGNNGLQVCGSGIALAAAATARENQNKGFRAMVLTVPGKDRIYLTVEIRRDVAHGP